MKLRKSSASGVALVIVLGFLVIITALAVAFFSSVTTELKASRNFASGVSTRQLADSTVQTVMGQIHDATSRKSGCWASQPGMIRVYRSDDTHPSANADAFFKLYSSDNMVMTKGQLSNFDPATTDVFTGWAGNPAYWTDLNAPVLITDPANPTGPKIYRYPIIDPGAKDTLGIDGFDYDASKVSGSASNPLPMPVEWIYVLQDGTLVPPDHGGLLQSGTTASFTGTVAPSQTNPIVGRIAFWTDDETSKLNVNTCAGYMPNAQNVPSGYTSDNYPGSFWDTPRFYTQFDMGTPNAVGLPDTTKPHPGGLAICQLLQNEFQRYPGHVGTTSLSPVFSKLTMTSDQLYALVPRYSYLNMNNTAGSSEGGTFRVVVGTTIPNPTPDTLQLQPKADRLYASVDELLWSIVTTVPSSNTSFARQTNNSVIGINGVTPAFLDKVRFFLTTQSRAPELNLFGQPRVSVWPVRSQTLTEGANPTTNGLNAFDNTFLFCSSVGQPTAVTTGPPDTTTVPTTSLSPNTTGVLPYRYIFTRREVRSPKTSYPSDQLPASYGSTVSGTSTADVMLTRNRQLMSYLQKMTSTAIPGFGGNFMSKYGTDNRDGILAEIFDYIRCANALDTTTTATGQRNPAQFAPQGLIMPTRTTLTSSTTYNHGMGRFPTVSEATLDFYYAGPRPVDPVNAPFGNIETTKPDGTGFPKVRRIRAFLVFSTFNPMQGYAPTQNPGQTTPKIQFNVKGLDKLTMTSYYYVNDPTKAIQGDIVNKPIFPTSTTLGKAYTATDGTWTNKLYLASGGAWGGRNYGGYEGFMHTLVGQNTSWAPHKIARAIGGSAFNLPSPQGAVAAQNGVVNSSSTGYGSQEFYELQSPDPNIYGSAAELAVNVKIDPATGTDSSDNYFAINGAALTADVLYGGLKVQTLNLTFPPTLNQKAPQYWPIPRGDPGVLFLLLDPTTKTNDPTAWVTNPKFGPTMKKYYWQERGSFYPAYKYDGTTPPSPTTYQTTLQSAWSLASRISWSMQNSYDPQLNTSLQPQNYYDSRWHNIVQPGDTIRSLVYCNAPTPTVGSTNSGDMRLALLQDSPSDYYPHPEYYTSYSRACLLRLADGTMYFPMGGNIGFSYPSADSKVDTGFGNHVYLGGNNPSGTGPARFPSGTAFGNLPYSANGALGGVNGVTLKNSTASAPLWGDFDTGIGSNPDGPFGNKQDEGNVIYAWQDPYTGKWYYPIPYFSGTWQYQPPGNTFTSPSRQMPSPAMFGSLLSNPVTVNGDGTIGQGWTTLCFSPNPAAGMASLPGVTMSTPPHPGLADPKDHLLLDLFQMPVVEPYPISEPFSTAGKVNLNYKIAPFGYITRSTALRGLLTAMRVTGVPGTVNGNWSDDYLCYKSGARDGNGNVTGASPAAYRTRVDLDKTVQEFEDFFATGKGNPDTGFFKSASQICEVILYPMNLSININTFWAQNTLTGDNVREKPYVDLYNRVTTKSNTYTVHMRVQTLRQLPRSNATAYNTWNEGKDAILGEYRGSTSIERYIDPADRRFDPLNAVTSAKGDGVNPDTQSVEGIYRFRTVINKKFP